MIRLFRAKQYGSPVGPPRAEFGEKQPAHADCLRYDLAFHKPDDLSFVVFPVFKSAKYGNTSKVIRLEKWRSHGILLEPVPYSDPEGGDVADWNVANWITYRHPSNADGIADYTKLEPVTMAEFMKANRYKLVVRHRG